MTWLATTERSDNNVEESKSTVKKQKSVFLNYTGNAGKTHNYSFAISDVSQLFEEFGQGPNLNANRVAEHELQKAVDQTQNLQNFSFEFQVKKELSQPGAMIFITDGIKLYIAHRDFGLDQITFPVPVMKFGSSDS